MLLQSLATKPTVASFPGSSGHPTCSRPCISVSLGAVMGGSQGEGTWDTEAREPRPAFIVSYTSLLAQTMTNYGTSFNSKYILQPMYFKLGSLRLPGSASEPHILRPALNIPSEKSAAFCLQGRSLGPLMLLRMETTPSCTWRKPCALFTGQPPAEGPGLRARSLSACSACFRSTPGSRARAGPGQQPPVGLKTVTHALQGIRGSNRARPQLTSDNKNPTLPFHHCSPLPTLNILFLYSSAIKSQGTLVGSSGGKG